MEIYFSFHKMSACAIEIKYFFWIQAKDAKWKFFMSVRVRIKIQVSEVRKKEKLTFVVSI